MYCCMHNSNESVYTSSPASSDGLIDTRVLVRRRNVSLFDFHLQNASFTYGLIVTIMLISYPGAPR